MDTVLPTLALIVMQLVTSGAGLVFAIVLALLRRAPSSVPAAAPEGAAPCT